MTHVTFRLTAKNRDLLRNLRSVIEYGLPLPFYDPSVCIWPLKLSDDAYWFGCGYLSDADYLHTVRPMALPSPNPFRMKIQNSFTFLVPARAY